MRGGIFNKAVSLSLVIQMAIAVMPLGVQNVSATDSDVYLNEDCSYNGCGS